jgi:hypothetical protein
LVKLDLGRTRRGLVLAGVAAAVPLEDLDGGGLARSVRPEHGEDLAALDGQVETVDGALGTVVLAQVAYVDRGFRCHAASLAVAGPPA